MAQIVISQVGKDKLSTIAAIRGCSGAGLKVAKDAYEMVEKGGVLSIAAVPEDRVDSILADFLSLKATARECSDTQYVNANTILEYSRKADEAVQEQRMYDVQYVSRTSANKTPQVCAPVASVAPPAVSQSTHAPELDRTALRIYLYDVLTLECIRNKLESRLAGLNKKVLPPEKIFLSTTYQGDFSNGGLIHLGYDGKKAYIAVTTSGYDEGTVCTGNFPPNNMFRWLEVEANMSFLTSRNAWYSNWGFLKDIRNKNTSISEFQRVYKAFINKAPQEYRTKLANNSRMARERLGVSRELQQARRLLERVYKCNIIPGTFRYNLYAIWFLYDYINTSNESLSSAFLHFDLNEIKTKLDKVIAQQQEIIINQSLIMAQNDEMIEQNQMYLHKLSSLEQTASQIEYNTAQGAYYSEIAANNSEVCKWLSMANYLR